MARWDGAAWRPLGPQTEPRIGHVDVVCVHTMVGYLKSTEDMFEQDGYYGTESHFGIGGKWGPDAAAGLDGVVWQWQDTAYQADANGPDGNDYIVSVETADNAPDDADDLEPWTSRQVDALVRTLVWCCREHDVPAVLIPDSKPGRRGIGYHRLGCDPTRVDGGDLWSESYGKVCPGDRRIKQLRDEVIPRVAAELAGDEGEDDDMLKIGRVSDGRHFVLDGCGKRLVTPERANELVKLKWAEVKDVSADLLSEFPTYVEDGTHGGSTDTRLKAADDQPGGAL